MRLDQAKRMKAMETEHARLKKMVADLSLDIEILREAASGNPGRWLGQASEPGETPGGGGACARCLGSGTGVGATRGHWSC